ncbi:MAG TPA: class I SAM-dependent methyltransferase [Acidimicrobiales bacterium]|nr:class I SAM-dependent methyltransferase [Acidimicrobiales bacterium]
MEDYLRVNRAKWDELVELHAASGFYDLDGFRRGRTSLRSLELGEVGDVSGQRLLHLQCHFGLDTLSWARLGAAVTGVDFSPRAIELARSLAEELDIAARFVCADLYDLPEVLEGSFDIVYSSYGVLCWLADLPRWAEIVASFLVPGGRFHLVELHPFAGILDDESEELAVRWPYFRRREPIRYDRQGTYADRSAELEHTVSYSWPSPLGDVITSVSKAGLRVTSLREFPQAGEQLLPRLRRDEDGWWRLPEGERDRLPLTYALRAVKPERL